MLTFLMKCHEIETHYRNQKKLKFKNEFIDLRTSTQIKQRQLFFYSHYDASALFSRT